MANYVAVKVDTDMDTDDGVSTPLHRSRDPPPAHAHAHARLLPFHSRERDRTGLEMRLGAVPVAAVVGVARPSSMWLRFVFGLVVCSSLVGVIVYVVESLGGGSLHLSLARMWMLDPNHLPTTHTNPTTLAESCLAVNGVVDPTEPFNHWNNWHCATALALYPCRYVHAYWLSPHVQPHPSPSLSSRTSSVSSSDSSSGSGSSSLLLHPPPVRIPIPISVPGSGSGTGKDTGGGTWTGAVGSLFGSGAVLCDPLPDTGRYVTFQIPHGLNNNRQTFLFSVFVAAVTNRTLVLPIVKAHGEERPFGASMFDLSTLGRVIPLATADAVSYRGLDLWGGCRVELNPDITHLYWARPPTHDKQAWERLHKQDQRKANQSKQQPYLARQLFMQDMVHPDQWPRTWGGWDHTINESTHTQQTLKQAQDCSQSQVLFLFNHWGWFERVAKLPTHVMHWWHSFERAYVHLEPELYWLADELLHAMHQQAQTFAQQTQHTLHNILQQQLTHNNNTTSNACKACAAACSCSGSGPGSGSGSGPGPGPGAGAGPASPRFSYVAAHWRQSDWSWQTGAPELLQLIKDTIQPQPTAGSQSHSNHEHIQPPSPFPHLAPVCSGCVCVSAIAHTVYLATENMLTDKSKLFMTLVQQHNDNVTRNIQAQIQQYQQQHQQARIGSCSCVAVCSSVTVPVGSYLFVRWWSALSPYGLSQPVFVGGQLGPVRDITHKGLFDRDDLINRRISIIEQILCAHSHSFLPTHGSTWTDGVFHIRRFVAAPVQFKHEMMQLEFQDTEPYFTT